MPDLKKALKDFVATSNSGKYKDETELLSKFPELKGYDTKSLKDYVATSNSGKYKSEDELNSKFPELFTEKKKDNSVSSTTSPKLVSEGTVGSSGGVKSSTFTEQIEQPSISKNEYKTIDGKIKTLKPTPAVSKNLEVANTAFNYAKQNVNKELSLERLNDEVDNDQWTDKISQGFKDAYNRTVAAPLTVVNTLLGGNKNFYAKKYVPLEREKKQALQDLKKEKKSDENVLITDEAVNARAKQLFIEKDIQEQMSQLIDEALPSGYDREGVWKELKLEGLRSNDALRSAVASTEVYKVQKQELGAFVNSLTAEEKKNGLPKDKFEKYNELLEKAKLATDGLQYLAKNFDNYLAKANTDQEKLELFKYNYNDFDKVTSLLKNSTKNIVGGTVKIASEGAKFMAENINQEEMNKPLNALSEIGSELMNEAEKDNAQFYRYKASSINNWSDFGSFASQLGAEQIPILASIYLGGTPGLIAVSASSGGQKINQLEEDAKKPFGRVYSDGEKLLAGLLYAGAEYFPEKFGTARILKDLEKTVSAASTASRRMFTESFLKTTYKGLSKTAYNVGLEAGTELITAEGQITIDQELLGVVRTQAEKNEMRFESGVSGGLMGGAMTMTGGLIGLGVTQSKLYSDKKDIAEVQKLFSQINAINDEIENNEALTESERKELYEESNKLNNEAFSIVEKNANKGVELPIQAKSFLVEVNQQQSDIKSKAVEISNSNFSPEIKKSKLKALENEFNSLEEKRQSVLEGNTTAVDFLPLKEQETIKKEALQSLTAELNPDGTKDITITNEQIVKRANELLKKPTNTEPTPVLTEEQRTKELADFLDKLDPEEVKTKTEGNSPLLPSEAQQTGSEVEVNLPLNENVSRMNEGNIKETPENIDVTVDEKVDEDINDATSITEARNKKIIDAHKQFDKLIKKAQGNYDKAQKDRYDYIQENGYPQGEDPVFDKLVAKKVEADDKLNQLKQSKENLLPLPKNETAPNSNTPADGNVQSGTKPVGESVVTEPKNTTKESVQKPANGGTVEAKIDVSGIGTENYKNKTSQVEGRKREITIADGSKIKGQYKVVSADDILASHNEDNFSKTNGYPVNERGETINDRDYEKDKNAQAEVVKIAQDYDGRAIQQTPVVTQEGIVVDGNNRVMSRKLAAKKGTDAKYKEALQNEADMYGINMEDIANVSNPIIVFEAENAMPYSTETLSKFNKQDKKEKSSSGKAVEYSKTLSDKAKRQIAEVYDSAERPSDVTSDPKSVKQLRDILLNNGIVQSNEIPRYFDVDKNVMTKEGVSLMENIALGSVFNEATINTLSIQGMGDIRNKILQSLVGLINNGKLDSVYQLGNEISKAIEVIYQLKTTKQTIEEYLDQPDIFGEKFTPNIDEYAVILAISDAGFKKWLQNYNNNVGQPDIFKVEDEGITTKRDKSNETISDRKKQVPSNLRSDASVDAKEDGSKNGAIEGEVDDQQANKEDAGKPKLSENERKVRNHKGKVYQNPKDGYYYEVTGYNSGYYTLKDAETGKVSKEKEVDFDNNFIDVTEEIEKENKGITSESSAVQNGTNFDITQYQDNVFEVKDGYDKNAPTYKVVVGNAFDLDSSTITKDGKALKKSEKLPQGALLAIQNHVERFNPESKQREIQKFLNAKENPKAKPTPEVKKYSVRDLAEMQEGELSAAVFSALNKGDTFKVGNKTYQVTGKTVGKSKTEYEKKGKVISYTKDRITIKEVKEDGTYGKPISGNLIKYSNGNNSFVGEGLWSNLSRDIEGEITADLINENNPFHNKSDVYKLAEKSLKKENLLSPPKKSKYDLIQDQLNQWEKDLDQFGRENLSMGIPLVVAKGAIQAMKAALKAGKLAAEVLQAGLDYVRQTEWFKKLSQTEQSNIESDFEANFLNKINSIDSTNERQAENVLNRASSESISEVEAYNDVNDAFDRSNAAIENKKPFKEAMKNLYRGFVKKFTDRQFSAKMLLGKSGLMNTKNLMINAHGASGLAKMKFQESYDKIYKGLNAKQRLTLDKIIQARRFIAIDTNREARGLEPVTHPSFIDKNKSEKFLSYLEKELGTEVFADLNNRAEAYFDTYKTLLNEMLDNGLINQESYDSMQDVDYQPRVFLQFVTDFNGDLGEGNKQNNLDSGGLSADQIKSMKEGDASDLVLKSEWLLTNSLLARSRAMAVNNINKRFMTDEFPKAKARFEALDPKNLKGDDVRFYKYFKELQSKIIDNPVQGLNKSGKPKYKYDKTPLNFQKAYYYVDGKQNQFFIEKELHEAWFDNVEGIMGSKTKEFLSYASGSALVKGIATGNNPAFPIVNTPRDFLFTITFSDQYSSFIPKAMGQIAKDVAKSIKEIKKSDSEVLRKYMEYGGAMDFLSSQGKLKKTSVVGKVLQKAIDPKARDTFKKVFDTVTWHKISQYSEMMFRLGIFQRSINNQLKELGFADISEISDKQQVDDIYNQAVANARGILDFNQGGSVTKDLESVIPYINVAFQGGRVATSAFEKNPTQTTAKILQVATIASSIPVGISLALLSMIKPEDDEDKSAYEIYLHAMEGVSTYQKSKYMNIVLPFKNADGENMIMKIAKAQELSPIMSVTDDIYNNLIRSLAGKDKKSAGRILDDAAFTFNSNVMPIDFTSPAGLITRTPAVKAVLTYQTGYDFFRDQPLSNDIGKVPLPVEGANMSSTEDFYKKIGENYGLSPIRTKAFVESMITSPSTNPFVGFLYGGADAASSDKDMKKIGSEFATTLGKSTVKRVISYSTDFNRQLATNDKLQENIDKINIEKYRMKAKFNDLTKQFIAKEITEKELVDEIKKLDPNDQKSMVNRIKDKINLKNIDGAVIDIKYEQGAEAKALMIMHYYGDITDGSEDSKKIVLQMKQAKGVLTESVIFEYKKLLKELKSTKKRPD